jgi:hypothetical protein
MRVIVKYSSQVIGPKDVVSLLSSIPRSSSIVIMVYYLSLTIFIVKSYYSDIESPQKPHQCKGGEPGYRITELH